jgi:putative NADPH-quinone reductase
MLFNEERSFDVRISIIVAHPDYQSLNHAIAATAFTELTRAGHEVVLHDLYAERFDPMLPAAEIARDAALPADIDRHCGEITEADGIVIVHPNWWGKPPAILCGWIDRVMRPGVAYRFCEGDSGEGVPLGLLKAKCAVVYNTSNTEAGRERDVFGDPLDLIWKRCIFDLCGIKNCRRRVFGVVVTSTLEQREQWLESVRGDMLELFG